MRMMLNWFIVMVMIFLQGKGFSVSVGSVGQMMKMGVSADFSICKGTRKDGMACTMATSKYVLTE